MSENRFKGTGVALVTPFRKDGMIDFEALGRLVDHVIAGGVDFLVALGTTAETPTLSESEKLDVLINVIERCNKRVPVVAGLGGNDTRGILHKMETWPLDNVDALLSVSPYYNKPSQAGLLAHYRELNRHTPKPIILYNVPGRTGSNMSADTTLQLAEECEHIIGIKEASGNLVQGMELIHRRPKHFTVLSGDDNLTLGQIACGFDGVISVAANCFTADFCGMVKAALAHHMPHARQLHYRLLEGIDLLFAEGNPAGVKAVLHEMGICENAFRLPIVPVSGNTHDKIRNFLGTLSA
jgi:4-hydroxy-tetrahydrodipicolinate synthase